jgi:hypothetical protein
MKRLVTGLVVVVALALLYWRVAKRSTSTSATRGKGSAVSGTAESELGSSAPTRAAATHGPTLHSDHRVVRLTPDERLRVASQIQTAQKAHAETRPPRLPASSPGSGDDGDAMATAKQVLTQLQNVSDDIRASVAECARYAPDLKSFTAQITLTGDPDIGTLIDAPAPSVGSNGQQVPAAFDNCIRGQLQTLELPPMKTGDKFTADFDIAL